MRRQTACIIVFELLLSSKNVHTKAEKKHEAGPKEGYKNDPRAGAPLL